MWRRFKCWLRGGHQTVMIPKDVGGWDWMCWRCGTIVVERERRRGF